MKDSSAFKTGLACSCTAAVCCFTPMLVIGLGAVGLSAWLGWLDYVLLPVLAISLAVTLYYGVKLWRRRRNGRAAFDADLS